MGAAAIRLAPPVPSPPPPSSLCLSLREAIARATLDLPSSAHALDWLADIVAQGKEALSQGGDSNPSTASGADLLYPADGVAVGGPVGVADVFRGCQNICKLWVVVLSLMSPLLDSVH
ncbi:uncharacterized protein [Zea mays]|uniref:uncharacterized protein n=1 Tax=Zea mays TaxID=4577 RepID=UPI0009A95DC4|nr:uncharacterized protein LOC109943573 [Zea mays]|eukprot:XP_020402660.1 uncharacterized protein LOC109943573 [Zea mays]